MEEKTIPLFWLLKPKDRARLMQWYYDTFHENLILPPDPHKQPGRIDTPEYEVDHTAEVNKEMSQAPQGEEYRRAA